MVIKACCHVSSVKHKSLVHYLNACLLLQRCHFLILQYLKHSSCYNLLFAKFFSQFFFIFKTHKCNHQLPCLHGKLLQTEGLLRREKEAVFVLLGLTPIAEVVHRVEMCFAKCLTPRKVWSRMRRVTCQRTKTPAGACYLVALIPARQFCFSSFWQLPGDCSTQLCTPHIFRNLIDTQLLPSKVKFILGCVPA